MSKSDPKGDLELRSDDWARFERVADIVPKSPTAT
jgi:hypothetical protein